jgi:hypothetical protein
MFQHHGDTIDKSIHNWLGHAIQRCLDVLPVFNGPGRGDPHGLHGTADFLKRTTV